MQLSDADIFEFKRVYEVETGETLTVDEARDAANRLCALLRLIRDAIPTLNAEALAKLKSQAMVKERSKEQAEPTIT